MGPHLKKLQCMVVEYSVGKLLDWSDTAQRAKPSLDIDVRKLQLSPAFSKSIGK